MRRQKRSLAHFGTVERSFAGPAGADEVRRQKRSFRAWGTESEASLAPRRADEVRRLSASTHKSHAAKRPDGNIRQASSHRGHRNHSKFELN
ncbi:hypothetical protein [Paenibacillus sp. TCA20]|uniref:hypothetical protein n=1 Tax=Paenibacillus sp. TCA20 TaxID=1499968 RepID=UPI0012693689|nr:hypothetical protein [Paenibacillus sp. TCA20]